jgi:Protein of unknown function (DUF1257)
MSHLANIKTQMKDLDALVAGLERMGYKGKVERYSKLTNLDGYERRVDGTSKQAHVIIRQANLGFHAYNDIGFERKADGTIVSYMDKDKSHDDWMQKLTVNYNIEKSIKALKTEGKKWTESVDSQNRVQIRVKMEVEY